MGKVTIVSWLMKMFVKTSNSLIFSGQYIGKWTKRVQHIYLVHFMERHEKHWELKCFYVSVKTNVWAVWTMPASSLCILQHKDRQIVSILSLDQNSNILFLFALLMSQNISKSSSKV